MRYPDLYPEPLERGELRRRYKRFLADVESPTGEVITIHCPNTGSMKNCADPGMGIWYSRSPNPRRKYAHTWELSESDEGHLIGVNTGLANRLIREAVEAGRIDALAGYAELRGEVKYGDEGSRIDLLLARRARRADRYPEGHRCYVEVKSVTLLESPADAGIGYFPDAVSERGAKHLRELIGVVRDGERAVLCFCVQHTGIREVRPADHIDPGYGEWLRKAIVAGVEVIACGTVISPEEIAVMAPLPINCPTD